MDSIPTPSKRKTTTICSADLAKRSPHSKQKWKRLAKPIRSWFWSSEFGRRTYENGSAGTDHGKAGPMFLIGKNVKGGFYGGNPDFNELSQGDLIHKIDFRQVYATALDNWMGADSKVVLGQAFNPMDAIKG
ncbi:MAG: DUF1501 domain-containing protein [Fimbriimonadaceae bacterium]